MSDQILLVLLEASLRVTLLAALVAGLLWLLRVPRGAARHTAWLVVTLAMVAMPLLQQVSPTLPVLSAPVPDIAQLVTLPPIDPIPPRATTAAVASATAPVPVTDAPASAALSAAHVPASRIQWATIALITYIVIAAGFLLRLLLGLYGVRTIVRTALPVDGNVYESAALATPVTVGLIRPRIIVPPAWRSWPAPTRETVLTHERAHVSRRDPLVALIAGANRCVFWFHPLAWWLQRTLAEAAEEACDAAALRTVQQPRQYAEVLIAMAAASQRAGGRLARAGAHVSGGRLNRRIERILGGTANATVTRVRKMSMATGCAIAVVVAAACRSEPAVAPLAMADPSPVDEARAAQRREYDRALAVRKSAKGMSWEQVAQLEGAWRRNREDLETLEKLLYFYEPDISGNQSPDDQKKIAGRRPLILWLIENHPDSQLILGRPGLPGRIFGRTDWLMDPVGYDAAKKLWIAHAARPDVSADTLKNAAWFLDVEDKPLAERLLLQGQKQHPQAGWSAPLGRLYAQAILGSNRFTLGNIVNSIDSSPGEYAARVKAMLDASTDAALLGCVGRYLAQNGGRATVGVNRTALARHYLQRALEIDPRSEVARKGIEWLDTLDYSTYQFQLFRIPGTWPEKIRKLPEDDRLVMLVSEANRQFESARNADWHARHPRSYESSPRSIELNRSRARESWHRSRQYAEDALELARRLPDHPDHAEALFAATVAMGANAFIEGDGQTAVRYMLAAAEVPPLRRGQRTPRLRGTILETRLIGGLLQHGERETVIRYFERSAETRPADRDRLLAAAAAIKNGKLPSNYQRR